MTVLVDRAHKGVAVLRLNRPDRLNALTLEMVSEVVSALEEAAGDPTIRAVVFTGAGRAFCAGFDIDAFGDDPDVSPVAIFDAQERFAAMVRTIRTIDRPVVAAINGPAAGAGMSLALAADVRVCSQSAFLSVAALRLGLSSGECGMSWLLPRLVGLSRAMEILLTGRPVDADEADRIGLVSRVTEDADVLDAALELVRLMSIHSPFAIRMSKRLVWQNLENGFGTAIELENRTQILALMTEDSRAAVHAFRMKESPRYSGR